MHLIEIFAWVLGSGMIAHLGYRLYRLYRRDTPTLDSVDSFAERIPPWDEGEPTTYPDTDLAAFRAESPWMKDRWGYHWL